MLDRRELLLTGALAGLAPANLSARPTSDRYRPLIDAFAWDKGFQGVVMLGRHGRPLYAQATGKADIERNIPATVGTAYAIASISKMLTAVTVLKLIEHGRL